MILEIYHEMLQSLVIRKKGRKRKGRRERERERNRKCEWSYIYQISGISCCKSYNHETLT